ncbi:MAG: hypothetical protein VZT48_03995 [Bulleidia sp.]|nr:hypothetical protein [Bulleidia sp.]
MGLFEKKVTIFKKKDAETWKKIKGALKEDGIKGVHASHYFGDSVSTTGIAGMVDPRDFGVGRKLDRDIYYIEVKESQVDAAKESIRRHGLVAVVDEMADVDAARRPDNIKKIEDAQ